jgi:8-oxo-dGTP pyrophosphatase MutT (NUDIX family)
MNTLEETIHLILQKKPISQALPIEIERIKQAAVTVLLRENLSKTEILLIKRAEHPRDPWSGHLALPGGRADATDTNLIHTAAREMFEEVGIELDQDKNFIGLLPQQTPVSSLIPKLEITPLIAVAPAEFSLQPNDEVATAFWMPISELQRTGKSATYRYQHGEAIIKYPAYPSPHGEIWGITMKILSEFLGIFENVA